MTPLSSSSAGSEACHPPVMCVHCTARERSRKSDDRSMFHPIFRNMTFCTIKWYLQYTVYILYENGKNDSISLVLFFSDRRLPPRSSLFWLRKHHHIASVRPSPCGRSLVAPFFCAQKCLCSPPQSVTTSIRSCLWRCIRERKRGGGK